ncbi:MAG: PilZ domain-containing protein [Gammaproteobacteria bacterium]|nr:PilZ domain-containing protein [Gammaproteobacteria bacterium]
MKAEKQRKYFRLTYPASYRPTLLLDAFDYEIEDISEYGLKVKTNNDPAFMVDDTVMAIIAFPGGREFDLSGQVVRMDQGYVGLQLETPLPNSIIKSEALYLMTNFVASNQA